MAIFGTKCSNNKKVHQQMKMITSLISLHEFKVELNNFYLLNEVKQINFAVLINNPTN